MSSKIEPGVGNDNVSSRINSVRFLPVWAADFPVDRCVSTSYHEGDNCRTHQNVVSIYQGLIYVEKYK